jgi:hypothetical protein
MNTCRQCGKACPPGYTVTCGGSYCSQIESLENAARAARGRRRKAELYAEADKVRAQARGPGWTC